MKFRRQRRDELSINLTPLIDVVFLLLIFFMVSSTFLDESAIEIRLPEASGKAPDPVPQNLSIAINAKGEWQIGDRTVPAGNRQHLGAELERQLTPETELIVAADARAPHQAVMTLLDLSSQIGVNSLRFQAQEPQQGQCIIKIGVCIHVCSKGR